MSRSNRRRDRLRYAIACLAIVMTSALTSAAQAEADDDALAAAVSGFLQDINADHGDRIQVHVNGPTARMAPCGDPQPFLPGQGQHTVGRVTVGVRCPGDAPETRYIQADVRVYGTYFVATHDIRPGTTLTRSDIEARQGDVTRDMDRLPASAVAIVGQQARRRIAESTTLVSNMLAPPDVIRHGDHVKIEARGRGFAITTRGEALDDAAAGQNVRVRTESGTVLTGRPAGPGQVEVGP